MNEQQQLKRYQAGVDTNILNNIVAALPQLTAGTPETDWYLYGYDPNGGAGQQHMKVLVSTFKDLLDVETLGTVVAAKAGGGQDVTATYTLNGDFNILTTVATAGDSVCIGAPSYIGQKRFVKNNGGATAADIFPYTGHTIDGLAGNTAIRLAPNAFTMFTAVSLTAWETSNQVVAVAKGAVGAPAITFNDQPNMGFYWVSATQLGVSIAGVLVALFDGTGIKPDSVQLRAAVGTPGAGVTAVHYGDGRNILTVLTLTNAVLGAPTAGGNSAHGALVYTFPAGRHFHQVTSFNIGLTVGTVTTDTPDVGIGSVNADGNVQATLGACPAGSEDYLTGQTWGVALNGTAQAAGPLGATAAIHTDISLNGAANVKLVHLNAADGWAAGVTGNLTASGTIALVWTIME